MNFQGFGVGSIASYDNLLKVGEGTYGYVYKATETRSRETVALKRLISHKPLLGFPICTLREIKFLKALSHKNLIHLRDVVSSKGAEHLGISTTQLFLTLYLAIYLSSYSDLNPDSKSSDRNYDPLGCGSIYLVFDYVEHDLGIINPYTF